MTIAFRTLMAALLLVGAGQPAPHHHGGGHAVSPAPPAPPAPHYSRQDIVLTDQAGRPQRLYSDLIKGRTVVVSFIFTKCTTTCPLISAKLARVQDRFIERMGRQMLFLSVSVDPQTDTPARLATFARKHEAGRGWHFLTGSPAAIAQALKSLGEPVGSAEAHSERLLIINDMRRVTGGIDAVHASPQQIAESIRKIADAGLSRTGQAERYFSNLPVIDAKGTQHHFYRDVISPGPVVITTLFTRCTDACPLITAKLASAQGQLSGAARSRVRFVAISSDPGYDTPDRLKAFAARHRLSEQWTLLTGKPENVAWLLYRLGLDSDQPQDHSTQILIGNEGRGQWQRVAPSLPPAQLARLIQASATGPARP